MTFNSKRFRGSLIFGLLIIVAGVILLMERISPESNINFATYWPVLLIALGIGKMLQYNDFRNLCSAGVVMLIGTAFLLDRLHIIYIKELWPVALIIFGIMIIAGGTWRPLRCLHPHRFHHRSFHSRRNTDTILMNQKGKLTEETIDINSVLGGGEYQVVTKQFKGGTINTVMGSVYVDFREAEMKENSVNLDASAVMGSIEIRLPSHWGIVVDGTPVMGSVENKTVTPSEYTKKIIIDASAVMGSVEITN